MGDSHYKSNIVGKAGTEELNNFSKITVATVTASNIVGSKIRATQFIRLGTSQYIFVTSKNTAASIVPEATAISNKAVGTATPVIGSLALSNKGRSFLLISNTAASVLDMVS